MELRNMLKTTVLAALLAAVSAADIATAATVRSRPPRPERHEVRRVPDYGTWRDGRRHEISVKAGAFPFTMNCGHLGLSTGSGRMPLHSGIFATPDAVAALKVRYSPRKTSGGITAAYYYRVAYALSVGVAFTYTGLYGDIFDARNGRKVSSNDMATISVAPALRLQWLNLPTVRCYSAIAAGPAVDITSIDDGRQTYLGLSGTIVGVSVGRRLYGFAEIGAGMQGIFSAGMGYRF